jgi:hypothetical protein
MDVAGTAINAAVIAAVGALLAWLLNGKIDDLERQLGERLGALERRFGERFEGLERRLDRRLDERIA